MSVIEWFEINWLELGAAVLLFTFIVFAFRQGGKVRPLPPDEQPPVKPENLGGPGG
jgi:hypothetical protein